jgi:hypothetical protein
MSLGAPGFPRKQGAHETPVGTALLEGLTARKALLEGLTARKETVMSAPQIAGLLAVFAFALLILSTVLGSALFGSLVLADWSLIASQVCIWLARECFPWVFFPRMRRRNSSHVLKSCELVGGS